VKSGSDVRPHAGLQGHRCALDFRGSSEGPERDTSSGARVDGRDDFLVGRSAPAAVLGTGPGAHSRWGDKATASHETPGATAPHVQGGRAGDWRLREGGTRLTGRRNPGARHSGRPG
jgi:hypothetical protein